jgi:hypothetical protein
VNRWLARVLGALQLDPVVFEEVEHDHSAGPQALLVVLLASLAGGVGNLLAAALLGETARPLEMLLLMAAAFTVAWLVWSFVMMAVGTSIFGGVADMGEMQRTLGFAAAPGLLMILPGLGLVVGVVWSLVAMVIAVRQALDFSTGRAIWTVVVGAIATALVLLPAGCFVARHATPSG